MTPYIILITGLLSFALGLLAGENLGYKRGAKDESKRMIDMFNQRKW